MHVIHMHIYQISQKERIFKLLKSSIQALLKSSFQVTRGPSATTSVAAELRPKVIAIVCALCNWRDNSPAAYGAQNVAL